VQTLAHTPRHTRARTLTHKRTRTHTRAHTHAHTHARTQTNTQTHTHRHAHTDTHTQTRTHRHAHTDTDTHTHTSSVSMYYRSNQGAAQQGRYSRLMATIAHRRAQWGVCTITKRSEEGRIETTWLKVKGGEKEQLQMIYTPHERGTSVGVFQFHSKTVSFRIMRCLFELWQEVSICVCVVRFYCCYTT